MKRCSECGLEKTEAEFYKARGNCKECHNTRCGVWNRTHPDKTLEAGRKWQRNNREKSCNASKRWQALNPEKCKIANRRRALKRNYGISVEQYSALFTQQNGCCAICGRNELGKRRLDVDHNHETGAVRALLCAHCNSGLGQFGDRVDILLRAVAYLTTHASSLECQNPLTPQLLE